MATLSPSQYEPPVKHVHRRSQPRPCHNGCIPAVGVCALSVLWGLLALHCVGLLSRTRLTARCATALTATVLERVRCATSWLAILSAACEVSQRQRMVGLGLKLMTACYLFGSSFFFLPACSRPVVVADQVGSATGSTTYGAHQTRKQQAVLRSLFHTLLSRMRGHCLPQVP